MERIGCRNISVRGAHLDGYQRLQWSVRAVRHHLHAAPQTCPMSIPQIHILTTPCIRKGNETAVRVLLHKEEAIERCLLPFRFWYEFQMCNATPTKSPNSNEKQSRTPLNAHISARVIVEGYRTTWCSVFGRIHDHTVIAGNQLPLRESQTQTSTSLSFTTRMSIMGARRDFQAAPSSNDKESGRFGVQ